MENNNLFNKMMKNSIFKKYKYIFVNNMEVISYIFFGGLAFIVSICTFAIFNVAFGINELIANVLSWIITVLFAFFTNRKWVFQANTDKISDFFKQMSAFFSGRIITLIIEEAILFIFITWLGFPSILFKILAQVVVIVLNYFISKLFIFREKI